MYLYVVLQVQLPAVDWRRVLEADMHQAPSFKMAHGYERLHMPAGIQVCGTLDSLCTHQKHTACMNALPPTPCMQSPAPHIHTPMACIPSHGHAHAGALKHTYTQALIHTPVCSLCCLPCVHAGVGGGAGGAHTSSSGAAALQYAGPSCSY